MYHGPPNDQLPDLGCLLKAASQFWAPKDSICFIFLFWVITFPLWFLHSLSIKIHCSIDDYASKPALCYFQDNIMGHFFLKELLVII